VLLVKFGIIWDIKIFMGTDDTIQYAVVGISALYHDSGVALLGHDGALLFAGHEERYTRIKHDKNPPVQALLRAKAYAEQQGIIITDAYYYEDPDLKKDRQLYNLGYLWASSSSGFKGFAEKIATTDEKKLIRGFVAQILGQAIPLHFQTLHHMSHACSAFLPSPFCKALTVVLDGVGEWETSSAYVCEGQNLKKIWSKRFPHGLGLFYSAFTQLCGFRVNSGEYKLMGLAPYGEPIFLELILDKVLIEKPAPAYFELDLSYFDFLSGKRMVSEKLLHLFGLKEIPQESDIQKTHLDIAASAQKALEQVCGTLIADLLQKTGNSNVCLAGGVGLNCVNNSHLIISGAAQQIFIQPAAGDAGCAYGAALDGVRRRHGFKRENMPIPYLGSDYSRTDVIEALRKRKIEQYEIPETPDAYLNTVAQMLEGRLIGGWFWGRSEFGPRALGARSIIARPDGADMQSRVNLKVKFRESFRPFAPIVLEEEAQDFFEQCVSSPYMLRTYKVKDCVPAGPLRDSALEENAVITHLKKTEGQFQSITHVDGSARVQTVSKNNGIFYDLLQKYKKLRGSSVLINTSFNVRGEPIVETPLNAVDCFLGTDIDFLAIQGVIVRKVDVPESALNRKYKDKYDLD